MLAPGGTLVLGRRGDRRRWRSPSASQPSAARGSCRAEPRAAGRARAPRGLPAGQLRAGARRRRRPAAALGRELDERAVALAAAQTRSPAGWRCVDRGSADGLRRCAQRRRGACAARIARRGDPPGPLALVIGVLDDKDAAAMLTTLLPRASAPGSPRRRRARAPGRHAAVAGRATWLRRVVRRAAPFACTGGRPGLGARATRLPVLATGSVYLVGDLTAARGATQEKQRQASASERRRPVGTRR